MDRSAKESFSQSVSFCYDALGDDMKFVCNKFLVVRYIIKQDFALNLESS
jgi:hypothetical protein